MIEITLPPEKLDELLARAEKLAAERAPSEAVREPALAGLAVLRAHHMSVARAGTVLLAAALAWWSTVDPKTLPPGAPPPTVDQGLDMIEGATDRLIAREDEIRAALDEIRTALGEAIAESARAALPFLLAALRGAL